MNYKFSEKDSCNFSECACSFEISQAIRACLTVRANGLNARRTGNIHRIHDIQSNRREAAESDHWLKLMIE
ncbi:hypothetical protein ACFL5V_12135 [Fibrobacterota bacterium]